MGDTADILNLLVGRSVAQDEGPRVTNHFQKATSAVAQYAQLLSGNGYDFNAFPSPVDGVATNKTPLLPMIISLVPPRDLPTGKTVTRQIPSPLTANVSLTGVQGRLEATSPAGTQMKTIEQLVVGTAEPETVAEPTGNSFSELLAFEIDSLSAEISATGNTRPVGSLMDVEVAADVNSPELSLSERTDLHNAQVTARAREDYYYNTVLDRYRTFQEASAQSAVQLNDLSTRVSAPSYRPENDPYRDNGDILNARKRAVRDSIDELRRQAALMQELPPLFMYVNPATFGKSYDFIHSDGNKTREGFTVEFWGESQAKITATGVVGAFYTHQFDRLGRPAGGLSVANRRASYGHQNFMNLHQIYRNNGYLYQTDQSIRRISLVGAVTIFYDGVLYTGSFDSFSITQSEDRPFSMEYSFSFTVRFEQNIRERLGG